MNRSSELLKMSVSSSKTYEQCARKYHYTYFEKLPRKEQEHLHLGKFVHAVLEDFHNCLLKNPELEWAALLTDCFKAQLVKKKEKGEGLEFPLLPESKTKAHEMLAVYLGTLRKDGMPPVLVNEKNFSVDLGDNILVRGFIDRIDKDEDGFYTISDYKGLATSTPIPTPTGWTTMADLKVGDQVFGSNGKATNVLIKSEIHNRPCYKLVFSDKSEIVCDNVHLWQVFLTGPRISEQIEQVVSADQLFRLFNTLDSSVAAIAIKNPEPLDYPAAKFFTNPWDVGNNLDAEGTKELDEKYLQASIDQRVELLQGLMDSSGSFDSATGKCILDLIIDKNVGITQELLRTLGLTVSTSKGPNGKGQVSHRLFFAPASFNPFKFNEKEAGQVENYLLNTDKPAPRRYISSMEAVESVPTQCIKVDAVDALYVCGKGFNLSHNTGKSKYLDEFQLLIYGLALIEDEPELDMYRGSYIVLGEQSKKINYTFTRTDVDRAVAKMRKIANKIRTDQTWEPKPSFLCGWCDFENVCPAIKKKKATAASRDDSWSQKSKSDK